MDQMTLDNLNKNEILEQLASLFEKYAIEFIYTTDDDGIHIILAGKEIFCGFLFDAEDVPRILREAKG